MTCSCLHSGGSSLLLLSVQQSLHLRTTCRPPRPPPPPPPPATPLPRPATPLRPPARPVTGSAVPVGRTAAVGPAMSATDQVSPAPQVTPPSFGDHAPCWLRPRGDHALCWLRPAPDGLVHRQAPLRLLPPLYPQPVCVVPVSTSFHRPVMLCVKCGLHFRLL